MSTLLITQPEVKPPAQSSALPLDFLERYRQWLLQKGLGEQQAHWWTVWVQRFPVFRQQTSPPQPFPEAVTSFLDHQRREFNAQPWQIDHARKAIVELAAWWRTYKASTGAGANEAFRLELPHPPAKPPLSAEATSILRKVQAELRLHHYSRNLSARTRSPDDNLRASLSTNVLADCIPPRFAGSSTMSGGP
jgi:hypothetical protein